MVGGRAFLRISRERQARVCEGGVKAAMSERPDPPGVAAVGVVDGLDGARRIERWLGGVVVDMVAHGGVEGSGEVDAEVSSKLRKSS